MPDETTKPPVGRFAPSPTGALHTGSLATAVASWLMARSAGGRWLLRIDDLDVPRQVPGMADDIMETLELFGLYWDGEISWQSSNREAYQHYFSELLATGLVYPCGCSRREIAQAASAPHPDDDCLPYPGTCRDGMREGATVRSWRLRVPPEQVCFHDLHKGMICQHLGERCGDFAVRRGDGEIAYQLAVVVDDHLTGVTQVVRGEDLLPSTPRQVYIQGLLGLESPAYCHIPLVTGPGGAKLSKRDNLVSHHLGSWRGKEGTLLLGVLRFLGQEPPRDLVGAPCDEILRWAAGCFDITRLPVAGGELVVSPGS
ncbi:tRNA glutamyl-Q(34) synthetase GluQRS [Oryzomonas rubra]|uniref:Glutamyl-Q tRNA(Asp) synthetase n=1 Tax=Oryzomonas rubra TaxID=2509454 RepID=A0A5A9XGL6_9BACT|nr:tRNA glutamyl-Q(34) synthetase GluQRS [Oryzomonas rubra]KAA0892186.1 tRNA glutamyl-Q(34) synthetase GluQRS [Oryzomonas rubra]